eukprot:1994809-Amphidinium_carterae.1
MNAKNLELSAATLHPEDLKETRESRDAAASSASSRVQALSFLRERDYLSGADYDLWVRAMGIKPRATSVAAKPKRSSKAVKSKTEWTWEESCLKKHAPKAHGATLTEVNNHHTHTWTARYSKAPPGWQKTFSRTVTHARASSAAAQL